MERYDSYKDSGVDWIGQIPEHWNQLQLKYLVSCNDDVLPESTQNQLIKYVEISDVDSTSGIKQFTIYNFADAPSRARRITNIGDIIVSTVRTYLKAIARVDQDDFVVSTGFVVLRAKNIDRNFLFYSILNEAFLQQVIAYSYGVSFPAITSKELLRIKLNIPPFSEQQAIAAYLDKETGKLDAAVEKLERMVEVLKERKQLIISKAVTRGLDDSVPLKDSGVEWIGQIPEHWEIIKLKYISSIKGRIGWNGLRSEEFEDSSYAYLVTGQDFKGSNIVWSDCYQINQKRYDEDPEIQLKNGDLLITKDGSIGKVAKVSELDKPACLNSGIFVIKPKGAQYIQGFMYWLLNSIVFKSYTDFSKTGATISHLYQNVFEKMPCVLSSIKEQQAIAAYLDEKVGKLDEAIEKQLRMIELLKEHKQILISDVVTGKIKVA